MTYKTPFFKQLWLLGLIIVASFSMINDSKAMPTNAPSPTATTSANIAITYWTEAEWTPESKAAFEHAVSIWAAVITSPITINVSAYWGDNIPDSMLYMTGVNGIGDYTYIYPRALYRSLHNQESTDTDFSVQFNSNIDNWYFGLDQATPASDHDFATIALQAIGKGLGFNSALYLCGGPPDWAIGCWQTDEYNTPYLYDSFIVDSNERPIIDTSIFPNPSELLGTTLKTDSLYFTGTLATAANNGVAPKLENLSTTNPHVLLLDTDALPQGSPDILMSNAIVTGVAIHEIGPVVRAVLYDLGWTRPSQPPVLNSLPTQLIEKNSTVLQAIDLWAYVESDFPTDQLTFALTNTPSPQAGISLSNNRYIDIQPETDWTGTVTVEIQVTDPNELFATQSIAVHVVEQKFHIYLPAVLK